MVDYRATVQAHLLPASGGLALESMTPDVIDRWRRDLLADKKLSPRTVNKPLTVLHGIMERARRVWRLPANPVAYVEKARQRYWRSSAPRPRCARRWTPRGTVAVAVVLVQLTDESADRSPLRRRPVLHGMPPTRRASSTLRPAKRRPPVRRLPIDNAAIGAFFVGMEPVVRSVAVCGPSTDPAAITTLARDSTVVM